MTYAFVQDVPINEDVYTKVMQRMGPEPLEGLIAHLALRNDDDTLRYVDVWESEEACDRAFEQRIHPAVGSVFQEIGFRPAGEPARQVVHAVDVMLGRARS